MPTVKYHRVGEAMTNSIYLNLLELPFLAVAIFYSFLTAAALRGGIFGHGMFLMAWGMLVMAAGHILMMLNTYFGTDVLHAVFGGLGTILWVCALMLTWALMGIGLHRIYAASKG